MMFLEMKFLFQRLKIQKAIRIPMNYSYGR
jgi:hypothetical protein